METGRGNFRKLVEWLDGRSRSFLLCVSFLWLVAVGYVDYLTSPDIPLALFYLPPIGLAAWAAGSGWGAVAALSATGLWYLSELVYGRVFPPGYVAVWIAGTRTGFFLVVAWLVSSLQRVLHTERENARCDPMTGIANSRHFRELVQEEIDRAGRYGGMMTLVYVDIDRFKEINDRLGHLAGDNLLREVAEHLQRHLRSTDRVGRLGGDEFGLLLPETGLAEAERLLSRVIPGLREDMENHGWPVTASVGVVACIDPPLNVDEIIGMADEVMYSVKRRGRNGIACREFRKGAGIRVTGREESK